MQSPLQGCVVPVTICARGVGPERMLRSGKGAPRPFGGRAVMRPFGERDVIGHLTQAPCCSAEIVEVDSAVFVPGNAQTMTGPHGEWKKAVDSVQ